MKRVVLPLCLFAMAAAVCHAQEQEKGFLDRIIDKRNQAMQAQDVNAKPNPALTSPLAAKTFGGGTFSTKNFKTGEFAGTKSAPIKTFATHSFFGIKNPWFGRKVYDTYADSAEGRVPAYADRKYGTETFAAREFDKANRQDLIDANTAVPDSARPRQFIAPPKTPGVVDRLTENLHKDLSIDDVRELLNKGHGE